MNIYAVLQIVIGILLALTILIQQRSSGLSATFGGGGATHIVKRRGAERVIYQASIVLSVLFFALTILRWYIY